MTTVPVSVPILSKNSAAASPNSGLLVIIISNFLRSTRNRCSYSNCCSHSLAMSSLLLSRDSPDPQSSMKNLQSYIPIVYDAIIELRRNSD